VLIFAWKYVLFLILLVPIERLSDDEHRAIVLEPRDRLLPAVSPAQVRHKYGSFTDNLILILTSLIIIITVVMGGIIAVFFLGHHTPL